uniref:Uncharacterized protein n=1 Tax=Oryza punctata TaxID=4537 RepID=A0A0E0LI93_ORYPU
MVATREATPMAASSSSPLHIVVFPWLAFGHMIPFLELSKRLASRGLAVTFISTPRNAARLGAIPPAMSAHLRVVPLDLPAVDGLPEGAESTADVPPEKVELLKKAFDGLAVPFASLIADACGVAGDGEAAITAAGFSRKPDWIILDFAQNWIWPIAEEHKIPCAMFSIFPAAMVAFVGTKQENLAHPRTKTEHFMVQPPWIPFLSNVAFRRRHGAEWIAAIFRPNASGVSDVDRFWEQLEHACCRLIIYRSCPEAEPQLFPLLTELFAKPSIPAGLLMPPAGVDDDDATMSDDQPTIATAMLMQWLDEQPEKSVLYIALGSEAPLTADRVRELALGLELAGVRFLWALRTPSGNGGCGAAAAADALLPDGFRSRVAARGLVCTQWVPQLRILAHRAVGGFFTHCGWSSIFESLRFALPLVMLPLFADQGLGVQALPAREIGVEVAWNDDDGSFHRDAIAVAVRRVMVEEEGKTLSRKAKELRDVLGDKGRQEMYLNELSFVTFSITISKNPAMAATPPPPPSSPLHIVVFPWLAFGHTIPFLELSKRLARRGHAITFVSTPRNAGRLGVIPPAMSAHLRVVSLDLPAVDGLPEGAESTADVPPEKVGLLKKAFDGLAVPFASLVAETCATGGDGSIAAAAATSKFSRKPDWIILDCAQNWIWPIAEEHEIACAIFSTFPAALGAFVATKQENLAHPRTTTEDYMVQPAWIPFPSTITYRRHEAEWIATGFRSNASGVSDADRFWDSERPLCRLIVYRSCPEAELRLFPLLTKLYTKPAIPAGLLVPPALDDNGIGAYTRSNPSFVPVMQWLDKQPNKSVIYVSLGTEAPITADQMRELALGLELAGVRFLWALRHPGGISCHDDMLLPSGFEPHVAARGLVCTEWVPQVRVLAHGAVGAFLTHCGWGSTVESFHFG